MALTRVDLGIQYFPQFAADRAIANAQIYIGQPNIDPAVLANQIQAYVVQENGTQVAVPQPIRTGAGGVPTYNGSPVQVAVDASAYSVKVLTSTGSQIYYVPDTSDIAAFSTLASAISYTPPGYASATNAADIFNALYLQDYVALRAYAGESQTVRITGLLNLAQPQGIAGTFQYDDTDITSVDDGGITIVGADGRRWKRVFDGHNINAEWFEISSANSDNATQLIKLRDYMLANPDPDYVINFPEGVVGYTNNRWLMGVRSVTLECHSTVFQCKSASPFGADTSPFKTAYQFYGNSNQDILGTPDPANTVSGYKFNTVSANSTFITLSSSGDAVNFAGGDWVLLYGYDQQFGGFPPNCRYFEFKKIINVNTGTGDISFDTTLENSYDQDWWDDYNLGTGPNGFVGAPRVINMRTLNGFQENVTINGATFLAHPTQPLVGFNAFNLGGFLNVTLNDCNLDALWAINPAINKTFTVTGGSHGASYEFDKLVDRCILRNVILAAKNANSYEGLSAGTAVNVIDIQACKIENRIISMAPRHWIMNDNDIINCRQSNNDAGNLGTIGAFFGENPIDSLTITNNRLIRNGTNERSTLVVLGLNNFNFTIGAMSGNDILLTKDFFGQVTSSQIDIGMTLVEGTGIWGGVITRIYDNGTNIVIQGTWTTTPMVGQLVIYHRVKHQKIQNNPVRSGTPYFNTCTQNFIDSNTGNEIEVLRLSSKNIGEINGVGDIYTELFQTIAYVKSIYVHVFKAYTGASPDTFLRIGKAADVTFLANYNLANVGTRKLDEFVDVKIGGDTTTPANIMTFIDRLGIYIPVSVTSSPTERAEFVIDIELVKRQYTGPL